MRMACGLTRIVTTEDPAGTDTRTRTKRLSSPVAAIFRLRSGKYTQTKVCGYHG